MTLVAIPTFLKIWIGLHVISFVLGGVLAPETVVTLPSLVWIMLEFGLAWAMLRHQKWAWVVSILLAVFAFAAALPGLWELGHGINKERLWYLWGIPFGVVALATLLSRQARDWVNRTHRTQSDLLILVARMRRYAVAASLVLVLASCAGGDGAPPKTVPGTEAWANDERVGPLYEGQYVGQLEVVQGGACRGSSGSESTGSTKVTLRIDERCRVYVESLEH